MSENLSPLEGSAAGISAGVALAAPERRPLTYGELRDRLPAVRGALMAAGFQRGEVAALVLPNGPDLITTFLAVSGVGAAAPLNPALTESEFRLCLSRLGARALILSSLRASPAEPAAETLGLPILRIHSTSDDAAGSFTLDSPKDGTPAPSVRRTDAALLLFTSATTGIPKLVPLTWANLRAMAARETHALQLGAADRLMSLMPLFHLHGLAAVLAQLFSGGTVISVPGYHPGTFLQWLQEFQPTWFTSSPPLNRAILALAREHPEVFRSACLRMIRTTGATPEPGMLTALEEAAGVPVLAGYGLTETGGVTRNTPHARKPGSVGRSSGLEVAIMDAFGNSLPAEAEGEIVVRGASVTSGYLDDPPANQAAFRDGWFHTGDIGRLDADGFLFITGRLKEMIDRGGEKIIPQEVEDALLAHPAVAEAAAFAVTHRTLGEDVAAAVVLRDGATASEVELRRFAATRLARFKVPRRIAFLDGIPRTATGKPRRAQLAERFGSGIPRRHQPPAPPREPLDGKSGESQ